jgi:hypothetical protein
VIFKKFRSRWKANNNYVIWCPSGKPNAALLR